MDSGAYQWQPQSAPTVYVRRLLDEIVSQSPSAEQLAERMSLETGTRLFDWVDHLSLSSSRLSPAELESVGFSVGQVGSHRVWSHPLAILPLLVESQDGASRLAIKADSVVDFLAAHRLPLADEINGSPCSALRTVRFATEGAIELFAVERHGSSDLDPSGGESDDTAILLQHEQRFTLRQRRFDATEDGFRHAMQLIEASVNSIGTARTCDLFFAAERDYWQRRNRAARVQKARQDRLGLGWANHDHHTYRSSREHFHRLVAVLETLDFTCRERFYAGREAGWGAQVLEQKACGITVFADVDLAEDEVMGDFAHEPLAARHELGTVGLWCKLHGEAFLEAGMHHLECQFDFDAAREQLADAGISTMAPFTDFTYLRQAFTEGEVWKVDPKRIAAALDRGWIDQKQADRFGDYGAVGSHLEILERNDGYKGFNQTGISDIIKKTDPRRLVSQS